MGGANWLYIGTEVTFGADAVTRDLVCFFVKRQIPASDVKIAAALVR